MHYRRYFAIVVTCVASTCLVRAEIITLKNKETVPGSIKSESAMGVVLEGKADMIPAADILDIRYDKKATDPSTEFYDQARSKDASSGTKKELILEAMNLYKATLLKMGKEPSDAAAQRNVEYRIAYLQSRLFLEHGLTPGAAESHLKEFKAKYPNSWQISHCLQRLAKIYTVQEKYGEAEKIYLELSQAPIGDEAKQEAELLSAQLSIKAKKMDQAQARFQTLVAKLANKNSPFGVRVQIAQAECLAEAKKAGEANKVLRQILKDAGDRNLKAFAHNALGKNLYDQGIANDDKGLLKDARWEFLWVDVVYNQDKAEHAKALYYLAQTFDKLGEPDRAKECREMLASDQFAGTEYQLKAKQK